jgi:hypothetical protein
MYPVENILGILFAEGWHTSDDVLLIVSLYVLVSTLTDMNKSACRVNLDEDGIEAMLPAQALRTLAVLTRCAVNLTGQREVYLSCMRLAVEFRAVGSLSVRSAALMAIYSGIGLSYTIIVILSDVFSLFVQNSISFPSESWQHMRHRANNIGGAYTIEREGGRSRSAVGGDCLLTIVLDYVPVILLTYHLCGG